MRALGGGGNHVNAGLHLAVADILLVRHGAVHQGEQGLVLAQADGFAGVELGAQLAHQDVAGLDHLAAVALHAEALAVAVASVAGRALRFCVCHVRLWGAS